jgi:hypothetical protein
MTYFKFEIVNDNTTSVEKSLFPCNGSMHFISNQLSIESTFISEDLLQLEKSKNEDTNRIWAIKIIINTKSVGHELECHHTTKRKTQQQQHQARPIQGCWRLLGNSTS